MSELPFSQAAENNRTAILAELQRRLADARSVLEIGAGTGQHAVYFAAALPGLRWQPTEHPAALATLKPRCAAARLANFLPNLAEPQALDMQRGPWPAPWPDAIYTANTLHIVAKHMVESLFKGCGKHASEGSQLLVYGPFNYAGRFTSPSNAQFEEWLKARDAASGIRDQEWVNALAADAGYVLEEDLAMPANNRLLCWRKKASKPT